MSLCSRAASNSWMFCPKTQGTLASLPILRATRPSLTSPSCPSTSCSITAGLSLTAALRRLVTSWAGREW